MSASSSAKSEATEAAAASASLQLTVRDDGRGIDPGASPGFGLRGMQERVQGAGRQL